MGTLKTVVKIAKEAIKAHKIDAGISLPKKFKLNTCNWTPTRSRTHYVANRRAENQSRSRILL